MTTNLNDGDVQIRVTFLEMFRDRGYTIPEGYHPDDLLLDLKLEDFPNEADYLRAKAAYELELPDRVANLPFVNQKVEDATQLVFDIKNTPVYVMILEDDQGFYKGNELEQVTKEISRNLSRIFPDLGVTKNILDLADFVHVIVVYNATKGNKGYEISKFEERALEQYNLEFWPKHRLRFNVTKHVMVPTHQLLTEELAQEYLDRFGLTASTVQKMFYDDPVNQYYYGQHKNIYKIIRPGQDITYRYVVKGTLAAIKSK